MKQYWISFIIDKHNPWCCALSGCVMSLEKAMDLINRQRKNYEVLSAWVDTFDENDVKTTVFHECYLNAVGHVEGVNK